MYEADLYNYKITDYSDTNTILLSYYPMSIELGQRIKTKDDDFKDDSYKDDPLYQEFKQKVSLIRTKKLIYDYAKSNDWDYFCTFTFAPKEGQLKYNKFDGRFHVVDRYDYQETKKALSIWLNNIKKRTSPNLKYLFIAEFHKDGALHYHGLVKDINIEKVKLIPHGRFMSSSKSLSRYHTRSWKYGRNDFSEIASKQKVTTYITKYVTKDIVAQPGKQRLIVSKGLKKADSHKFYEDMTYPQFLQKYYPDYEPIYMKQSKSECNPSIYIYLSNEKDVPDTSTALDRVKDLTPHTFNLFESREEWEKQNEKWQKERDKLKREMSINYPDTSIF